MTEAFIRLSESFSCKLVFLLNEHDEQQMFYMEGKKCCLLCV